MLLVRSSSTPVLGSLVASIHTCETLRELEREGEPAPLSRTSSCNFSFLSALQSPANACVVGVTDDMCSVEGGDWDFDREVVPWPSFRRAQSESDLQSLGRQAGGGKSLGLIGKSMACGDVVSDGSLQRHWSRRMALRRTSSLTIMQSDSSESSQGFDSDIGLCGIRMSLSKGMYDLKEEDTPANSYMESSYLQEREKSGVKEEVFGFLDDPPVENLAFIGMPFDGQGHPDRLFSHAGPADDYVDAYGRNTGAEEVASVSGRETEGLCKVNDEVFTSTAVSATGSLLLCNAKGCRPLQEGEEAEGLFIAGGLGIGGGDGGGGGAGWRGVAGGGGSSGWGGFGTETDAYYRRMLEVHPGNGLLLRNYARFLHEVKKDSTRAEEYFERAILANPGDGELLAMYAKLIWDNYRDQERAGNYFDQAIKVAPDDSYVLAAYASFLWSSEDDEEDAAPETGEPSTHIPSMRPYGKQQVAVNIYKAGVGRPSRELRP